MKKKILLVTILFITLFMGLMNIRAATDIRVHSPVKDYINGTKPTIYPVEADGTTATSPISFSYSTYYIFRSTNGNPIFCLDPYHPIYTAGNYTYGPYSGNVCGIIAGLKSKDISLDDLRRVKSDAKASTESEYIASYKKVQNYLWKYLNYTDCDVSYDISEPVGQGEIKVDVDSKKLTYHDDSGEQYYLSEPISITVKNINNYTIDVRFINTNSTSQEDIIIYDDLLGPSEPIQKNTGYTISGSRTVYLKVPYAENLSDRGDIQVIVEGEYIYRRGTTVKPKVSEYKMGGTDWQKIGLISYTTEDYSSSDTLRRTKVFSIEDVESLTVLKVDSETQKPIENVMIGLYSDSSCSSRLSTVVTDKNGQGIFTNLVSTNNYYVKEVSLPEGLADNYSINTECIAVNLGETDEIKIENTPQKGSIIIKKYEKGNESLKLKDAKFVLSTSSDCKKVIKEAYTNSSGELAFNDLRKDTKYYISEIKAPDGYKIDDGSCKAATVGQTYTFTDTKIEEDLPFTKISKLDISSEKEVYGAEMEITSDVKDFKTIKFTSTKGAYEVYLKDLGKDDKGNLYYYYLKETVAPEGYDKIETVFRFIIDEFGEAELKGVGKFEKDKDGNDVFKSESEKSDLIKIDGDTIIIYNQPTVEVPDTGKMVSIILWVVGISLVCGGAALICQKFLNKKDKKA